MGGRGVDVVEQLVRLWLFVAWQQGEIDPDCSETACSEEKEENKEDEQEKKK